MDRVLRRETLDRPRPSSVADVAEEAESIALDWVRSMGVGGTRLVVGGMVVWEG